MNMESDDPERPSKGSLKRQAEELQELGEALIDLPDEVLDQLPLPEILRDAVANARRFTSHGASLRQRQYIGKLMRKIDAAPIREAIEARRRDERLAARRFRRVETWRDRLLGEPDTALAQLQQELPAADLARVRALLAQASAEAREGRAPRAARLLFQYLRDLMNQENELQ
jgi:ribosome-associated protein